MNKIKFTDLFRQPYNCNAMQIMCAGTS